MQALIFTLFVIALFVLKYFAPRPHGYIINNSLHNGGIRCWDCIYLQAQDYWFTTTERPNIRIRNAGDIR